MLKDGHAITQYLLTQPQKTNDSTSKSVPEIQNDGRILITTRAQQVDTHNRTKRFLISSAILGWKIHKNKQSIKELRQHINTLYE